MKESESKIWLFNKKIDLLVLFLPVWITWVICFLLPQEFIEKDISVFIWLLVVVGIDVSHVWSTIFRTYTDKTEFSNHKSLLITAPILAFSFFLVLATISHEFFWRVLAYIALFHFIKQQYGFMRIYKAKGGDFRNKRIKDNWVIYTGMIYPVVYWHFSDQRSFSWFVEGDFLNFYEYFAGLPIELLFMITNVIYWLFILAWLIQEVVNKNKFYLGKVLWVFTTAVNWYLGIVYFNSDFVFTLTNVIAHGLPYMALVFFYVEKKKNINPSNRKRKNSYVIIFRVLAMLTVVMLLALGEEYFWDMWVNRENESLFESILPFPMEAFRNKWGQAFALALLTVPQATHYIIDGFIWKSGDKNPYLKRVLMNE